MLPTRFITSLIVLLSGLVYSQQLFFQPESAAFDSETNSYFISNFSGGNIIHIDSIGTKSVFKEGLSNPCGIVIYDSVLYVAENPHKVSGFKIEDGTPILEIPINEAVFLNDITYDDKRNLYVTDTRGNAVFKINRIDKTYSLLVKTSDGPNGIIYDKFNDRLLVCYFRKNSAIDKINIKESTIEKLISTHFDNLDGMTFDEFGNCYVSSFGPGSFAAGFKEEGTIYKYDKSFKDKPAVVQTGLYGPADIYYNVKKKELVIPLFLANKVEFLNIK